MRHILIALVRLYQLTLSPFIGRQCRFVPTCSCYSIDALSKHGALKGTWMTLVRLARCHPWGGSGYDPVPERFRWKCWCPECSSVKSTDSTETSKGSVFEQLK